MKKVLFAALAAALSMTACKSAATQSETVAGEETTTITGGDMAFVNTERVLMECELFKTEGLTLKEKTEKAQKSWANKEQSLQYEAAQLQEKYQKGLITTRDAQAQQEALEKKITNYQTSAQKEAQTLDEENFVFTNRMQDLLLRSVEAVNEGKKFKMVFNASALLDADMALDITDQVLAKMNELYAQEKKAK